ncbi:MAG: hypothetical protein SFT93_01370 [Rickettsiaceae bacterium]|nr:hypothetical protein [Rickettsiaceae bacterium]
MQKFNKIALTLIGSFFLTTEVLFSQIANANKFESCDVAVGSKPIKFPPKKRIDRDQDDDRARPNPMDGPKGGARNPARTR